MRRKRVLITAPVLAAGLLLAGCANDGNSDSRTEETSAPEDTSSTEEGGDGCFIHFFDGEDLDDQDDNFQLIDPGEYKNLADLPGADRDWTDEADSLRVGSGATVTIYSEENFEGTSKQLEPDTEIADVEHEPKSLEMVCE